MIDDFENETDVWSSEPFIIAEIGVNHCGSVEMARELIEVAAACGAQAVKFQVFNPDELAAEDAVLAPYQVSPGGPLTQRELLRQLTLRQLDWKTLAEAADSFGVEFMATAFDRTSLEYLVDEVGIHRIKIPSGEITNGLLLLAAGRCDLPILVSTGMADLSEISEALAVIGYARSHAQTPGSLNEVLTSWREDGSPEHLSGVHLLHCTSAYPTPIEEANTRAISTLMDRFGLPVGYSDHSSGYIAALTAVAQGAQILEKHLTLDKDLPGPDHKASASPTEFAQYVSLVRQAYLALGHGRKETMPCEAENRNVVRRSLKAAREVSNGDTWSDINLIATRPCQGLSPMHAWDILGRPVDRNYHRGESVSTSLLHSTAGPTSDSQGETS